MGLGVAQYSQETISLRVCLVGGNEMGEMEMTFGWAVNQNKEKFGRN